MKLQNTSSSLQGIYLNTGETFFQACSFCSLQNKKKEDVVNASLTTPMQSICSREALQRS